MLKLKQPYSLFSHLFIRSMFSSDSKQPTPPKVPNTQKIAISSSPSRYKNAPVSQILSFLYQASQMTEKEINSAFDVLIKNKDKIGIWQNLKALSFWLKKIKIDQVSFITFRRVCELAKVFSQNQFFQFQYFDKVGDKIQQLLVEPDKLSNNSVLIFMEVAYCLNRYSIFQKLLTILKNRIINLEKRNYERLLQIIEARKIPSKIEKQVFGEFLNKLMGQFDHLEDSQLVVLYKYLKSMNSRVFGTDNLVRKIENKIKERFEFLVEKDIVELSNFKSHDNIFLEKIRRMIFQFISEQGTSQLSPQVIFTLLKNITLVNTSGVHDRDCDKTILYLQKNFERSRDIIKLISNGLLRNYAVKRFNQSVVLSNRQEYLKNIFYLYELTLRNCLRLQNCRLILEQIKNTRTEVEISESFFSTMIVVGKIRKIDGDNVEIRDIQQYFISILEGMDKINTQGTVLNLTDSQLVQRFHSTYSHIFLPKIVNRIINQNEGITNNLIVYLIYANDWKTMSKLILSRENLFKDKRLSFILAKAIKHPFYFVGCFGFLNKLIDEFMKPKFNLNCFNLREIQGYLCSSFVHSLLKPDQIQSFLFLARRVIQVNQNALWIIEFMNYFISSKNKQILNHKQYLGLLNDAQYILINRQKQLNTYSLIPIGIELMKFSKISRKFAELFERDCDDGNLGKYCKIIMNIKLDYRQIEVNERTLVLFLKSRSIDIQILQNNKQAISNVIQKANIHDIEIYLINADMNKSEVTVEIYKKLLVRYSQLLKEWSFPCRLSFVLKNLSKSGIKNEEVNQLIRRSLSYFQKRLPLASSEQIREVVSLSFSREVDCSSLLDKLMKYFFDKSAKMDLKITQLLTNIDFFILANVHEVEKLVSILTHRKHKNKEIGQKLPNMTLFTNFANSDLIDNFYAYFKQMDKISIEKGIFTYLATKRPQFQSFQHKLQYKPLQQKCSEELLENLCQFLKKFNKNFEVEQRYGHRIMKMKNTFIFFTKHNINRFSKKALIDYFTTVFNVNRTQQTKIVVIFETEKINRSEVALILSKDIEELRFLGKQLRMFLFEAKKENQKDRNPTLNRRRK